MGAIKARFFIIVLTIMASFLLAGCPGGGGGAGGDVGESTAAGGDETTPTGGGETAPLPTGGSETVAGSLEEGDSCAASSDCQSGFSCIGGVCTADADGDLVADDKDNCIDNANADQADMDADGKGDECDDDSDGDGVKNAFDNCPKKSSSDITDTDNDGTGDACDDDIDGDVIANEKDNCPKAFNPTQYDENGDGEGSACEATGGQGPDVEIGDAPETYTKVKDVNITYKIGSQAVKVECKLVKPDGVQTLSENCTAGEFSMILSLTDDGSYGLYIKAWDQHENVTEKAAEWVLDTTAPKDFTFMAEPGWRSITLKDFLVDGNAMSNKSDIDVNLDVFKSSIINQSSFPIVEFEFEDVSDNKSYAINNSGSAPLYNGLDYSIKIWAVDEASNSSGDATKSISLKDQFQWENKTIQGNATLPNIAGVMTYDDNGEPVLKLLHGMNKVPYVATVSQHGESIANANIDPAATSIYTYAANNRVSNMAVTNADGVVHYIYIPLVNSSHKMRDTWWDDSQGKWVNDNVDSGAVWLNVASSSYGNDIWYAYHRNSNGKIVLKKRAGGALGQSLSLLDASQSLNFCPSQPSIATYKVNDETYGIYLLFIDSVGVAKEDCAINGRLKIKYCAKGGDCDKTIDNWSEKYSVQDAADVISAIWPVMALDEIGCPHIVYNLDEKLLYKTLRNGDTCESVDKFASIAPIQIADDDKMKSNGPSSIAIDDNGAVHVMWYCYGSTECQDKDKLMYSLIYTKYDSTKAYTSVMEEMGEKTNAVTGYPSIFMADDGSPWGCYAARNFKDGLYCDIDWDWPVQ